VVQTEFPESSGLSQLPSCSISLSLTIWLVGRTNFSNRSARLSCIANQCQFLASVARLRRCIPSIESSWLTASSRVGSNVHTCLFASHNDPKNVISRPGSRAGAVIFKEGDSRDSTKGEAASVLTGCLAGYHKLMQSTALDLTWICCLATPYYAPFLGILDPS
jgi:hypothetical protein